jgi:hypothetical protein
MHFLMTVLESFCLSHLGEELKTHMLAAPSLVHVAWCKYLIEVE